MVELPVDWLLYYGAKGLQTAFVLALLYYAFLLEKFSPKPRTRVFFRTTMVLVLVSVIGVVAEMVGLALSLGLIGTAGTEAWLVAHSVSLVASGLAWVLLLLSAIAWIRRVYGERVPEV